MWPAARHKCVERGQAALRHRRWCLAANSCPLIYLSLQAISWLLSVPGASRTVLDVRVPYSQESMTEVLGFAPALYTNAETAAAMARAAFRHAASLTPFGTDIVGIAATCALATDREKRGQHKAFVCTYSCSGERGQGWRLAALAHASFRPANPI